MSSLSIVNPDSATGKTQELLAAVKSKLGLVPNMTKVMANSPAVLEGYLAFSGALSHSSLSAKLREQIALLVAEVNKCSYCLSAHTAIGKMVGLTPAELSSSRAGGGASKDAAALKFARVLIHRQGEASDDDLAGVRTTGYSDAQIAEIIAVVALNVFTNYFNKAARVPIDFPIVTPGVPA